MPATIHLGTMTGCIERGDRYDVRRFELLGTSLGRETVTAATVADVRAAVQAFGTRMRAAHPDASFMVSVSIRKGDRKPNGYDKAYLNNGFGQGDFLRVVDRRTMAAVDRTQAGAVPTTSNAA